VGENVSHKHQLPTFGVHVNNMLFCKLIEVALDRASHAVELDRAIPCNRVGVTVHRTTPRHDVDGVGILHLDLNIAVALLLLDMVHSLDELRCILPKPRDRR
jgi:hypothetical protein